MKNDAVETYELSDNRILEIFQDETPESPRDWDNLGSIVCWSRKYDLSDKGLVAQFPTPDSFNPQNSDYVCCLPIYMYDHSGVWLSTLNTYPFNDRWDAGQKGWIFATKEKTEKEFGPITDEIKDKVIEILISEVETYSQFLSGEVYGYVLSQIVECEKCRHKNKEHIESLWGFFGHNINTNGMLDNLPINVVKEIEKQLEKSQ